MFLKGESFWTELSCTFPSILHLDAVKRRTLPLWIREGLEKMDREKQKKLERERMELERVKVPDDDVQHQADEEGDGPHVPRKSKFVSVLLPMKLSFLCFIFSKEKVSVVCEICVQAIFRRFVY